MPIKPKPMLTLPIRPGSTEHVFAQTLKGAETLWRETQIENLIDRTVQLFRKDFSIPSTAVLRLCSKAGNDQEEKFPAAQEGQLSPILASVQDEFFSSTRLKDFYAGMQGVEWPTADDGIQLLTLDDVTLYFARLGGPLQEPYIILWIQPEQATESEGLAIEFLIKQLQNTYSWFARIAETQALLHLDDLTGLYNHRYLNISLDSETKRSMRYGSNFCLLFIDLDHFKPVNDTYGHLAGSQVLREVAAIIRATVRDVDLVFRFGGDEFVVMLIEADSATGLKTAVRIQERIQAAKFVVAKDSIARVTSSIGVAAFPEHADEKDRLIALADECMYESKRRGKNQCVLAQSVVKDSQILTQSESSSTASSPESQQKESKSWPQR